MIVKSSKNPEDIIDIEEIDGYLKQIQSMNIEYILNALDIMNEADSQAKWSTQPRIILEMAAIKLVKLEDKLSLEERVKNLENGIESGKYSKGSKAGLENIGDKERSIQRKKEEIQSNTKQDRQVEKVEESKEEAEKQEIIDDGTELTLERIKKDWKIVINEIKSKKINIYALIMEGEVLSFENNQITIGYNEGFGFHKDAISGENNKKIVEEIASQHFNKNLSLRFIMKGSKIIEEPKKIDNEAAIEKAKDFFGEDILEIK